MALTLITNERFQMERAIRDAVKPVPTPKSFWRSARALFTSEAEFTASLKARQDAHLQMWVTESTAELGPEYVRETLKAQLAEIERAKEFA